jgi:predicted enzyme related to lactoylglutathione lyase
VPPTDIPDTGRFAMLQDPQGATFSVIALSPMPKA